jgi:hypothetical protein
MVVMVFKTFRRKSNLRVRTPSRDGMRAIEAPWAGRKAGRNRPKWPRFGGFLPSFGPALRGRSDERPDRMRSVAFGTETPVLGIVAQRKDGAKPVIPPAHRTRIEVQRGLKKSVQWGRSQDPERGRSESSISRPASTVPTAATGGNPTDIALPTVGQRAGTGRPAGGATCRGRTR